MAELELITSERALERLAENAVSRSRHRVSRGQPYMDLRPQIVQLPALVNMYLTRIAPGSLSLISVVCDRHEAKRLVYPRTNQHRSFRGDFRYIEGEQCKQKLKKYIHYVIRNVIQQSFIFERRNEADTPLQRELINEAMNCVRDREEPLLVTYRTVTPMNGGTTLIEFFIVSRGQAQRLVYYSKNKKKLINRLEHLKPRKVSPYNPIIGNF